MTLSPARKACTPAPTSFTTPASSLPGEKGSGGLNWYLFWMMRTSGKFRLAAFTDTTTSPGPARGEASSSTTSESGGPNCRQTTAFTRMSRMARNGNYHSTAYHHRGRFPMRIFQLLLLALILPFHALAQDTYVLKRGDSVLALAGKLRYPSASLNQMAYPIIHANLDA